MTINILIEKLVSKNPQYLYEVLPYAYAMGLSKRWMNRYISSSLNLPENLTVDGAQCEILGKKFSSFEAVEEFYSNSSSKRRNNYKGHYKGDNGGVIW